MTKLKVTFKRGGSPGIQTAHVDGKQIATLIHSSSDWDHWYCMKMDDVVLWELGHLTDPLREDSLADLKEYIRRIVQEHSGEMFDPYTI